MYALYLKNYGVANEQYFTIFAKEQCNILRHTILSNVKFQPHMPKGTKVMNARGVTGHDGLG